MYGYAYTDVVPLWGNWYLEKPKEQQQQNQIPYIYTPWKNVWKLWTSGFGWQSGCLFSSQENNSSLSQHFRGSLSYICLGNAVYVSALAGVGFATFVGIGFEIEQKKTFRFSFIFFFLSVVYF